MTKKQKTLAQTRILSPEWAEKRLAEVPGCPVAENAKFKGQIAVAAAVNKCRKCGAALTDRGKCAARCSTV